MKYTILILLLIPCMAFGQTASYLPLSEYYNLIYNSANQKAYHILNVVPQLCTNQPTTVDWVVGGPHDAGAGSGGGLYMLGSVFSTGSGAFDHVTVDSAGNALPFVSGLLCTASYASPYWLDVIWTTDSTTGRQVGMAGSISGGIHGNGDNPLVNQTSFVWAKFPIGTHIVKVVGQYGLKALDSKGHVWSWGYFNVGTSTLNKASLGRGTTPTVSYLLPDTILLPSGRHAVDICDEGDFGVILLDDGSVWGTGDQAKYWGGPSASSSNTPQNFTSFLTSAAGLAPGTGTPFVVAKVRNNSGAVYYIGIDSSLVASGDNICGQIGNGQMFPMNNYKVSPAPNGSTPQPYAYDNGFNEYPQYTPVRICPGAHNWVEGYMGPSNCWNASFVNNLGENWTWGRGKSMQTGNNRASCNYVAGGLNGTYPDMINIPYPVKISPFTITSGTLVTPTCFYCIANPGAANCSQGTGCYNGSLAAPIVNGNKQVLASTATTATITPSITYASGSKEFLNIVTFVSGPNPPLMPFNTGSTMPLSGLVSGTYIFKDSSTDIMWKTGVSYDTVIVGGAGGIQAPVGRPIIIVKADSTIQHSLLVNDANYYTIDTLLLPPNSIGTFQLFFFAYDTVRHYFRSGQQTVTIARIGNIYQAPYSLYIGGNGNDATGLSTEMVNFVVTLVNGLPLVRADGFAGAIINLHVVKDQKITPL
jgi:hypothetical protein